MSPAAITKTIYLLDKPRMVFETPIYFQPESTFSLDCFGSEDQNVSVFRLLSLLEPDVFRETISADFPNLTSLEQLENVKEIVNIEKLEFKNDKNELTS